MAHYFDDGSMINFFLIIFKIVLKFSRQASIPYDIIAGFYFMMYSDLF